MLSLASATTCAHQRLVASFGSVASSVPATQKMAIRLSFIILWNKVITRRWREHGATFRRRAGAGPGGPAQTRGSAPPGAESGSIREWDLVGLLEVDPRNWVRLGFLLFRLRPIRGGGRGGVGGPQWLGGIGARSGSGSAERAPRCGASECSCGSPWRARNCDSGRG